MLGLEARHPIPILLANIPSPQRTHAARAPQMPGKQHSTPTQPKPRALSYSHSLLMFPSGKGAAALTHSLYLLCKVNSRKCWLELKMSLCLMNSIFPLRFEYPPCPLRKGFIKVLSSQAPSSRGTSVYEISAPPVHNPHKGNCPNLSPDFFVVMFEPCDTSYMLLWPKDHQSIGSAVRYYNGPGRFCNSVEVENSRTENKNKWIHGRSRRITRGKWRK